MSDESEYAQIELDYDADLAAIDRRYVEACEAVAQRRRNAIAEATRLRAERIEATHRNVGVFA